MAAAAFIFFHSIQAVELLFVFRFPLEGSGSHRCASPCDSPFITPAFAPVRDDEQSAPISAGDAQGWPLRRAPSPGPLLPGSPSLRGARGRPSAAARHPQLSFSVPAAPRRAGKAGAGRGRAFPPPPEEVT